MTARLENASSSATIAAPRVKGGCLRASSPLEPSSSDNNMPSSTILHDDKPLRCVWFNEAHNQYHYLGTNDVLDYETKRMLWYDCNDFAYFQSSLWTHSQALLQRAPEAMANVWMETLATAYHHNTRNHKRRRTESASAPSDGRLAETTTTTTTTSALPQHHHNAVDGDDDDESSNNSNHWKQRLAEVYTQAPDLVGLEYYVMAAHCREDASARKRAIRGALRLSSASTARRGGASHRHLGLLSRKLSQRSQCFVREIAQAQSQALRLVGQ